MLILYCVFDNYKFNLHIETQSIALYIARWATLNLWTSRAVSVHVSSSRQVPWPGERTDWRLSSLVFVGSTMKRLEVVSQKLPNVAEFFHLLHLQCYIYLSAMFARGRHIFKQLRAWLRESLSVPVEHVHRTWPLFYKFIIKPMRTKESARIGHSTSVVGHAAFLALWRCQLQIASQRCILYLCWCHVLSGSASWTP
jgi:hypothetical protein